MNELVPHEVIENKIFLIRGHNVMMDKDLATLYGVPTKVLNQTVQRNLKRFPEDFMFQTTADEAIVLEKLSPRLRSQFVTSKRGGARYLPYLFTEQGVAMLSSVLNSNRAIQVNIIIMRTFVKLREILSTHKELAHKLKELEGKIEKHDGEIQAIFEAIRQLMAPPPEPPKPKIGFHP
ncbi:MAG: ORF6N domain-containing protein [Candidatus Omnitrophica bacterium]|nr:ORF6N domain-containing protein [Candidatus Omnitrophota bacterium]MBU1037629.1 ORF6N domain-containing protein [Candidatus Omnitrophota bacterium]MBU1809254.1 ORF6N domain-containing protein [Candidatus Omnitrophota bacterium]